MNANFCFLSIPGSFDVVETGSSVPSSSSKRLSPSTVASSMSISSDGTSSVTVVITEALVGAVLETSIDVRVNNSSINNSNNEDNKKINIKNEVNNNSKNRMKNNFFDSKPKRFMFDYVVKEEDTKDLLEMDEYSEELADMYMYEEDQFKKQGKDIIYKYDKDKLQVEGMKILFTRLQKDPNNRNVMVRKSKSGKCYIYDTEWVEKKLQEIITKICNRLCDTLYNKETSLNHFVRLVLGSQPRRYVELRRHIEDEIINIKQNLIE